MRKKKKIFLKELNKKSLKLLSLLVSIILICIVIYYIFIQDAFLKINLEKDNIGFSELNENLPFALEKILLFSSATAESDSLNQLLSLNISQYCDIAIYLNKLENIDTTISSLYIDNISISSPEIGTPYLYKKNINDMGKSSFEENNIIGDRFDFNIINSDATINYSNYEIYNNCTTPISLGFYNKHIKSDFILDLDSTEVSYNGLLLKEALIPLTSLYCNVSFTINIITNSNEHYICNVNFDIPFEDQNGSIYETGHVIKEFENSSLNKFIRIK